MPKRIRLTFNRNQDSETQHYRVFRDDQPDIDHKTSQDRIVMKVDHPRHINPITVGPERLTRETEKIYALAHRNILLQFNNKEYPFEVTVNGEATAAFGLDVEEGKIVFDEARTLDDVVIAKTYTFDGVQVWDYEAEEEGKTYYGPEAKDTSAPSIPQNITIEKEIERNRLILKWDVVSPKGKLFYYRIDAAIDDQRYSKLGLLRNVFLQEPLADRPYLIERSDNGKRWVEIARVKSNVFYEYMIDRSAPSAITTLTSEAFLIKNAGRAQIELKWDAIRDDAAGRTSMYRVRVQNRVGITGEPSVSVGPIPFKVELSHILIRRKVYDGSLPSYDGNDAETIATLTKLSETKFLDMVSDNTQYVYGMWVVDKGGNYSAITSTTIFVADATPPAAPTNLIGRPFHVIVG